MRKPHEIPVLMLTISALTRYIISQRIFLNNHKTITGNMEVYTNQVFEKMITFTYLCFIYDEVDHCKSTK